MKINCLNISFDSIRIAQAGLEVFGFALIIISGLSFLFQYYYFGALTIVGISASVAGIAVGGGICILTLLWFILTLKKSKATSATILMEDKKRKPISFEERKIIPLIFQDNKTPACLRLELAQSQNRTCMCDFSLVESDDIYMDQKNRAQEHLNGVQPVDSKGDRAIGILLGMAVGDAVGAPLEFNRYNNKGYNIAHEKISMEPGKITGTDAINESYKTRFRMQPGQWTDDASMGLCLADILIQYPETLEEEQLMWAFYDWWNFGYNNAFTKGEPHSSVGLGGNIGKSLKNFKGKRAERNAFRSTAEDKFASGNGSLMRNGPVAIIARSLEEARNLANRQSKVTHQGDEAAACCELMAYFLYHALNSDENDPIKIKNRLFQLLDDFECEIPSVISLARAENDVPNYDERITDRENWNWKDENFSYNEKRCIKNPGYIGAYAMDGLAMALHCVYTTDSFEDAVEKAVRCGGDADTVGAITAQIAGSIYGARSIPRNWIEAVQQWDRGGEIAARALILDFLSRQEDSL